MVGPWWKVLRVMHSGPFKGRFLCVMHGGPFERRFLCVMHGGPSEGSFTRNAWWAVLREALRVMHGTDSGHFFSVYVKIYIPRNF